MEGRCPPYLKSRGATAPFAPPCSYPSVILSSCIHIIILQCHVTYCISSQIAIASLNFSRHTVTCKNMHADIHTAIAGKSACMMLTNQASMIVSKQQQASCRLHNRILIMVILGDVVIPKGKQLFY